MAVYYFYRLTIKSRQAAPSPPMQQGIAVFDEAVMEWKREMKERALKAEFSFKR
jgi:hypothetical protein